MTQVLSPGLRHGRVTIPSSKSQAHRLLICAALGQSPAELTIHGLSNDIRATIDCLQALGADIRPVSAHTLRIVPLSVPPEGACTLPCGESGSTLRFLLPVAGALGAKAVFSMEGRLPQRPLEPLAGLLQAHGMTLRQQGGLLSAEGRLTPGAFSLPGNVSSQYVSGLLMALPLLSDESTVEVTGPVESAAYISMTEDALARGGVLFSRQDWRYSIPGGQRPRYPASLCAEGDYSNAAFFLCMGAFSPEGVTVDGLDPASRQGDRAILRQLTAMGAEVSVAGGSVTVRRGALQGRTIDAAPIPDLIPVLSVAAAVCQGETNIVHAGRLRLKESDRLRSTAALLTALGGQVEELPEGLRIRGVPNLRGGTVDCCGDHRIAMSAAAAACICREPVTVCGSECVSKSYPDFWVHYAALKGASL